MPFPLDYTGTITWHSKKELSAEAFQEQFQAKMAATLEREDVGIEIAGERISFTVGPFRMAGIGNVLTGISSGYIETAVSVDQVVVTFHLRFTLMFVGFLIYTAAVASLMVLHRDPAPFVLLLLAPVIYGFNLLLPITRFPGFVERVMQRVTSG